MAAIAESGLQPGDKVLITCVDGETPRPCFFSREENAPATPIFCDCDMHFAFVHLTTFPFLSGFAGSHLAKHLLAAGYAVKGIVAEKSDDESFSHFVPEGVDEAMLEVLQINLFSTS